jgi:hypothetical protein
MATPIDVLCHMLRAGDTPAAWQDWTAAQWEGLVAVAQNHGVETLLHQRLGAQGWLDTIPARARHALQVAAYASAAHNLRLYHALEGILAALAPLTPLVVLKGAALGPGVYANPTQRPLTDLDLLAPAPMVEAVTQRLIAQGYQVVSSLAPELTRRAEPHIGLFGGPGDGISLEIHWGLIAGSADWRVAPAEWFWQQTEPWTPPPAHASALEPYREALLRFNPTAQLLYLAAHLVLRHGYTPARLIWLYDLHLLICRSPIDWRLLISQAYALGWAPALALALKQIRSCFATPTPDWVIEKLPTELDRRASFYAPHATSYRRRTSWTDLAQLDPPTRLRMFARLLFPNRDYLRASYQPTWGRWWPLAYPYRWLKPLFRLLTK